MISNCADIFADAREKFTVPQLWAMLGLSGEPKAHGVVRSPFRDERNASFSIFDQGRAWKDQATGEGGDVVEFVRIALGRDYQEVRQWFASKLGHSPQREPMRRNSPPPAPRQERKVIEWPGELMPCGPEVWDAFAKKRGISYAAVWTAVRAGLLRFLRVNGVRCFAVLDATGRAAEIRRIDGGLFGKTKAFPLRGVSKDWLPGLALAASAPRNAGLLVVEGCTDFLSAIDLYARYRRSNGSRSWIPCAMLGAACKTISREAEEAARGRRVRIVPDADEAGDKMAAHWRSEFHKLGCTVDVVKLPRGKDLTDMRAIIKPWELYDVGN